MKSKILLLLAVVLFLSCGNVFASTDIGIGSYLTNFQGILKGIGIALIVIALLLAGAMMIFQHGDLGKTKPVIIGILAGGILMSIASTAADTIFSSGLSASGAVLSESMALALGLI
jgi:type IV secretory pathway VirB2 component (pilin)